MTRIDCVGGIVTDHRGRFLLIRRGHEPDRGRWSIPGGKVEPGESDAEATAREVLEETGLPVEVGAFVGAVERDGPGGVVYLVRDYRCAPARDADLDAVRAGDDADDVGWFTAQEVRTVGCSPLLVAAFEDWGLL
jgi:ADP-ribose pyrophosphatase YjhB (NUDIX family)